MSTSRCSSSGRSEKKRLLASTSALGAPRREREARRRALCACLVHDGLWRGAECAGRVCLGHGQHAARALSSRATNATRGAATPARHAVMHHAEVVESALETFARMRAPVDRARFATTAPAAQLDAVVRLANVTWPRAPRRERATPIPAPLLAGRGAGSVRTWAHRILSALAWRFASQRTRRRMARAPRHRSHRGPG